MICWLNGVFTSADAARIDPRDRGFLLGDGLFETLLAEHGAPRRYARHLARLRASAEMLDIPFKFTDSEIVEAIRRLLSDNQLTQSRAAIRITLSRGAGARGLLPPAPSIPTLLLMAAGIPPPLQSMRAIISSHIRNEKSIGSRIKSLNYLDNIMARREAEARGADEALMRNSMGAIASASAANIFIMRENMLLTPAIPEGALPGVMRGLALEAAAALNIPLRETRIEEGALRDASEAFLSSSLIGICPFVELDGWRIGDGEPGPLTQKLQNFIEDRE